MLILSERCLCAQIYQELLRRRRCSARANGEMKSQTSRMSSFAEVRMGATVRNGREEQAPKSPGSAESLSKFAGTRLQVCCESETDAGGHEQRATSKNR